VDKRPNKGKLNVNQAGKVRRALCKLCTDSSIEYLCVHLESRCITEIYIDLVFV